ncbi:MAG TPA: glycoside hydrolase family 13 protein [Clostridiaceae bacterium]|nr:glycoside hydrolase family 13 protein [Clostridiaceae bacterium]
MISGIIIHEPTREYVYPLERNKLAIRLRTKRGFGGTCVLVYWNRCKKEETYPSYSRMECYARDNMYDYYETIIVTEQATRYINYYFEIEIEGNTIWLNYYGQSNSVPDNGFFEYLYTNEEDIFKVPDWLKDSIFYQIFPERFCNGDTSNDPFDVAGWGSEPTRDNFMGGDLKGIEKRLDYLAQLGVNAIYLNPVFESPTNHKYDTVDYFKIDPHFGNLEDLKMLVNKCHLKGIRIILDGVFNHIGYYSKEFQDVIKNGDRSNYKSWFYIESFPVDGEKLNFETIGYYKMMPKLRLGNPEVRAYILKVASYWIEEAGIDGWRLDCADEVDYTFWHEFRKVVKSIKADCFILAETWRENRDMLRGDQMDSVMNYVFRDAVTDFFAKQCISSMEFDSRLNKFLGVYPKTVHFALFNLIGSHDTPRFLTLCKGNIDKMKAAAAFQFCFPGIPVIYYGDEIGMEGGNDPECRKAMEWESQKQNMELLEWYKKLIQIRNSKPALRSGSFKCNYCSSDNSVYSFFRELEGDRIYIVINNSDECANIILPVKESYKDIEYLHDMISGVAYKVECKDNKICYNDDINNYKGAVQAELKPYQVCIISK